MNGGVVDRAGGDHRPWRELIGAYVLGQLATDERASVEQHLEGCPSCRAEVGELAPLADLLRRVDPAVLDGAVEPGPELEELVVARLGGQRRTGRRRPWIRRGAVGLGVAASLVAAVGIGVAVRPALFPGPPVRPVAVATALGVQAEAGVVRHTWGTEVRLHASGLSQGVVYAVRFQTRSGAEVSAGSVIGTGAKPLDCSLNAAVPMESTTHVEVVDRSGAVVIDGTVN